jgi:Outer membrane protein beta-barrel domain
MRKILFLMFTLFAVNVYAQQDSIVYETQFGVGVTFGKEYSLTNNSQVIYYPISITNIYFTIDISPVLRIEPEFGIFRTHSEYDQQSDITFETTSYNIRYGVGIFYKQNYEDTKILIGGRIGTIHNRSSSEFSSNFGDDKDESTSDDFYLGFATGGEYMLSDHISIGGEAQLNYIILGSENNNDDYYQSILATRTLVILRFYY